jgi:predicted metalloendopeptidase
MKRSAAILLAAALAVTACGKTDRQAAVQGTELGINPAAMDKSVVPGDDFFSYANGTWFRTSEIPADRASIGATYTADKERERRTREMLDEILNGNAAPDTNDGKIANYYRAYLDTDAIDRAGMAPARADMDAIARIADKRALAAAIGGTLRADTDPLNATNFQTDNLFGIFVTQGLATPGETLPYLMQGGIGLPEREYYLSGDKDMADIRAKYRAYIATIMKAAGNPDPEAAAGRVMDLDTKIAQAHDPRSITEDYTRPSVVWTRAELEQKAPGLDWGAMLGAAQLGSTPKFQMYNSLAVPRLAALVGSEPLENWKDWLAFHTLNQQTNVLPKPFRDAAFGFYGTTLSGTTKQRERADLAMNATSNALQDAVGKAYVDRYFPAAAKAKVQQMVENIKAAFAKRVQSIAWMAPSTKQEATRKVESLVVGVGYPDTWRDYSSLSIGNNAYANQKNAGLYEYRRQIAKIGKPMDRSEWWMPAQLVNAVNLPVQNALNFPAAILQKPYFDLNADDAFNYGATGATIGHEISHSFDDNGAMFDSKGVLRKWWTPADYAKFKEAGAALAAQYDQYEALPGLKVNGKLTLGENIADVAGLAAAYDAYRASLKGKEAPVIDGFTGDQRFFIAYAQAWASKRREQQLRQIVLSDAHSPDQFRAITVRNLDAWYKAFNVQPGQKLYLAPDKRVQVWK